MCRPSVTTGDAMNIAQDTATIVGNAFSCITGAIHFAAIQYAPRNVMNAPMIAYAPACSPFTVMLTGLLPGTAYDYRAVVVTCDGCWHFGALEAFVTLPPVPVPMVTTGDAVNITQDTATIVGNAFSGITGAINFVGVQYGTDPNTTEPMIAYGTTGSPFTVNLTGLQPDTTYYYRAIVSASDGEHYGPIRMFTTPPPAPMPVVVTGDATQILLNSAVIIGNTFSGITDTIYYVGVQYDTNPAMTGATLVQSAIESPFNTGLVGLQPGTTYYYRAVVGVATGSHYGEIKSFTTPS